MGQDFVRDAPGSFDKLSNVSLSPELLLQQRDTRVGLERMLSSSVCSGQTHIDTLHSKSASRSPRHRSLQRESLCFMKGVMDECTHIANFSGEESIQMTRRGFMIIWIYLDYQIFKDHWFSVCLFF